MSKARLPYLPALDGLRALAIIAVMVYHAEPAWLPGGFLGVDMFFVISAYLITALLICEYNAPHSAGPASTARRQPARSTSQHPHELQLAAGRNASSSIDLRAFWLRRARRLLPAAFVLIAFALIVSVLWLPDEVAALRGMSLAAAGYATNWYLIFSGQSYFESTGRSSLLRHLWSLAVEEQFYLLWPLLLLGLLRIGSRRVRVGLVGVGIVASTLWMAYLYQPGADPSRVYFGSDTRAATLLVGAALALVWSPWRRAARARSRPAAPARRAGARRRPSRTLTPSVSARVLTLAGSAALLLLAAICWRVNEADERLYRGGLLAIAVLSALAIAAAADTRTLFARVLACNPLRWIGLRSYSLYLWHWPVLMLTRPQLDIALEGLPLLALQLTLTLGLAELSYRLVEMPLRHGALGAAWRSVRAWRSLPLRLAVGAGSLASLAAFVLLGRAVALAAPPEPPAWLLDAQRAQAALQLARASAGGLARAPDGLLHTTAQDLSPVGSDTLALYRPGDGATARDGAPARDGATARDGSSAVLSVPAQAERALRDPAARVLAGSDVETAALRVGGDSRSQAQPTAPVGDGPDGPPAGAQTATLLAPDDLRADGALAALDSGDTDAAQAATLTGAQAAATPVRAGDAIQPGSDILDDSLVPSAVLTGDSNAAQGVAVAQATASPAPEPPTALPPVSAQLTPERAAEVTAIGDSVMLSAVGELRRVVGAIDVDAQLGRQSSATVALLRAMHDANALGQVVIIQTGDNGYLSVQEMRALLELTSTAQRVVFINLHVPRAWEQNNNDILRGESQGRPNVVLVDWSAASAGHPEYFWNDGMHLRPEGAHAYALLVAAALAAP